MLRILSLTLCLPWNFFHYANVISYHDAIDKDQIVDGIWLRTTRDTKHHAHKDGSLFGPISGKLDSNLQLYSAWDYDPGTSSWHSVLLCLALACIMIHEPVSNTTNEQLELSYQKLPTVLKWQMFIDIVQIIAYITKCTHQGGIHHNCSQTLLCRPTHRGVIHHNCSQTLLCTHRGGIHCNCSQTVLCAYQGGIHHNCSQVVHTLPFQQNLEQVWMVSFETNHHTPYSSDLKSHSLLWPHSYQLLFFSLLLSLSLSHSLSLSLTIRQSFQEIPPKVMTQAMPHNLCHYRCSPCAST